MVYFENIEKGGVTEQAGIKSGDIILTVNDERVLTTLQFQLILNSLKNNEIAEYRIIRNDAELKFNVKVHKIFDLLFYVFALLSLIFLVIGFLVGYSTPQERTSQLFYFLGMCCSLGFMIYGGIRFYIGTESFIFYNCYFFSFLLLPIFIHFFVSYPIEYKFKFKNLFLFINYFLIFFILIALSLNITYAFVELPISVYQFFEFINLIYIIIGLSFFIRSFYKIKDTVLKNSLKIILNGFIIGGLGFIYYFAFLPMFSTIGLYNNPVKIMPVIAVLAIPLSLGYSIFKYRILETEFIIKKSLVFGIVTACIVGLYLLIVFLIDNFVSVYFHTNKQVLTIAVVIIITFTFDFVNQKAKDFIDQELYRDRSNYRQSLLEFTTEIHIS